MDLLYDRDLRHERVKQFYSVLFTGALAHVPNANSRDLFRTLLARNFIKRETPTQVFSCEYCEFLENSYFEEHLRTTFSIKTRRFYYTCLF